MAIKRITILRVESPDMIEARVAFLRDFMGALKSKEVSLRVYTSQEDASLLVEAWVYPDEATELELQEQLAEAALTIGKSYCSSYGTLELQESLVWRE